MKYRDLLVGEGEGEEKVWVLNRRVRFVKSITNADAVRAVWDYEDGRRVPLLWVEVEFNIVKVELLGGGRTMDSRTRGELVGYMTAAAVRCLVDRG